MSEPGDAGQEAPEPPPSEEMVRLRHDLANPLAALLAEVQLLLLDQEQLEPRVVTALREIEALAMRMRTMLRR